MALPDSTLSTGPLAAADKQISSRNALTAQQSPTGSTETLKHGSCSTATLILDCESIDDFLALEKRWFKGYDVHPINPATEYEAELIRTAARADWFFLRADRNYSEIEAQMMNEHPNLLLWNKDHHATLQLFLRYRTAHANSVSKHRKAIEDYRKNRTRETAHTHKILQSDEKLAMQRERLQIYREKNKPEPTWEEEIENMTQQAIRMGFRQPDPAPETQPAK